MKLPDNLMTTEMMLEELAGGHILEEKATMDRWAKTRRQKIIMNISFESEVYNIYDPRFSSEDDTLLHCIELEQDISILND